MCSIVEDDFGDLGGAHAMLPNQKGSSYIRSIDICSKCKTEGVMVIKLEFRQPECKDCFQAYVRHKFRATLGSSKILPKGANVLLIFDGSAESITLWHMMNFAQTQNHFKRLHCKTKVLLIDESQLIPQIKRNEIREIIEFLLKYETHFQSYIVSIAKKKLSIPTSITQFEEYLTEAVDDRFKTQIANIRTLISRQDYVKIHKRKIMQEAAQQLDCDFIFMPDISTSLAAELLKNICLGRGGTVALDVSLLDTRLENVKIIRPIKDLTDTEVKFYMQVNNLPHFRLVNYGEEDNRDPSSSIQNLTQRFVKNLQKDYSSTVSTVFRVGSKIATKSVQSNGCKEECNYHNNEYFSPSKVCPFCHSTFDHDGSKTLVAMEVSQIVCNSLGNDINKINEIAENAVRSKDLCHGCSNIQNDFVNKINLV